MNREILFRGKRVDNGEWIFGQYLKREFPSFTDYSIWTPKGTTPVIPETIGQYTGLKDKKGVKIFEGDLLEDNYIDDGDNEVESSVAVIWDDTTACWAIDNSFLQDGSSKTNLVDYLGIENLLIVGNIHDNE